MFSLPRGPAALFALASAIIWASPSFATPEREDGDGFRVKSSEPADYQGTRQDVESNLTDELAEKLRQFDEWIVQSEEQSAANDAQGESGGGGSQGGGGANVSQATTSSPSAADGQIESTPSWRPQTTIGEAANTVAATDRQGTELSQDAHAAHRDGTVVAATDQQGAVLATPSVQPPRADKVAREDDVARMIREAAEQETDPVRKKALMEQYDAYLENL